MQNYALCWCLCLVEQRMAKPKGLLQETTLSQQRWGMRNVGRVLCLIDTLRGYCSVLFLPEWSYMALIAAYVMLCSFLFLCLFFAYLSLLSLLLSPFVPFLHSVCSISLPVFSENQPARSLYNSQRKSSSSLNPPEKGMKHQTHSASNIGVCGSYSVEIHMTFSSKGILSVVG